MPEYYHARSIGGTDAGAIIGKNSYKTPQQVWDRIQGLVPDDDGNGNMALVRGKVLEPYVLQRYPEQTRRRVEPCELLNHSEHPFLHARPDGVITGGLRVAMDGPGILEIKVPGSFNFREWKLNGIDESYYAQIQHYMYVTGFKWGAFAVLNPDTFELWEFDVERDEPFLAHMVDACVRFWNEYVETGIRPPSAAAVVEQVWPKANIGGEAVTMDTPEAVRVLERLQEATAKFNEAKHGKELAENDVKALMGETPVIVVPGIGKVSWKESSRMSFDKDTLMKDHPDIDMTKYEKYVATRVFRPSFGRG